METDDKSTEPEHKAAAPVTSAEELAALDAAADRLRELHEEKREGGSSRRPLILAAVIFVLLGTLIYNLPSLLLGQTVEGRLLERSLAYCKYDGPPNCEKRMTHRTEVCLARKDGDNSHVFGGCMLEEFPDYYVRIGDNLPKK